MQRKSYCITSVDISTLKNPHNLFIIPSNIVKEIPTNKTVEQIKEEPFITFDCGNENMKESILKQIEQLPMKSRVKLIHLKANEGFSLKSCKNISVLEIDESEIDTAVDVNDIYPSSIEELSCPYYFLPQYSDSIRVVTIINYNKPIDLMKYTNLDKVILRNCSLKEKMSFPRCCRIMHIKTIDKNEDIDLSYCKYVDELIIDSIYQAQFALPIYLSNLIIINSKYFALTNQEKLNLHNLAIINSQFMFFDLNKMTESLDMLVFK